MPINKARRHLHFISIYIRALQFVGINGENRCIPRTIPNGIREGFEQSARYFYGIDEIPEKKPRQNGTDDDVEDDKVSYRQLTVDLFNAALANTNFVVTTWRIKYKANALLTGCHVVTESCQWRSLYHMSGRRDDIQYRGASTHLFPAIQQVRFVAFHILGWDSLFKASRKEYSRRVQIFSRY